MTLIIARIILGLVVLFILYLLLMFKDYKNDKDWRD